MDYMICMESNGGKVARYATQETAAQVSALLSEKANTKFIAVPINEVYFLLEYTHRHGVNYYLCRSHEHAEAVAADVVLEWLDEITDEEARAKIQALIAEGKHWEAVQEYESAYPSEDEERFEIEEISFQDEAS